MGHTGRMPPPSAPSLLDPPRALRSLTEEEAPYGGRLHAGSPPAVWVAWERVPEVVWRCLPDGHMLTPLDLARTTDGHAAILPHCPARLASAVGGSHPPGVVVTVAVSMLRAAAEARAHGIVEGSWWVDAAGRPVLAAHDGAPWLGAALDGLELLGEGVGPVLTEALSSTVDLLSRPSWRHEDVESCEDALFGAAEPLPLDPSPSAQHSATQPLPPRRVASLRAPAREATPSEAESLLARFTDASWAARVGEAVRSLTALPAAVKEGVRERRARRASRPTAGATRRGVRAESVPERADAPGGRPRRRRAPLIVAAAVGATVVVGGLLWPDAPPAADANGSAPTSSATTAVGPTTAGASREGDSPTPPPPTSEAGEARSGPPTAANELERTALATVSALRGCVADGDPAAANCDGILERAGAEVPNGVVSSGTAAATATLLDEYGGVAVLRIEESGRPPQILVLVTSDGKWLIRDVYDVADQP